MFCTVTKVCGKAQNDPLAGKYKKLRIACLWAIDRFELLHVEITNSTSDYKFMYKRFCLHLMFYRLLFYQDNTHENL